jgi:hypothetical protein
MAPRDNPPPPPSSASAGGGAAAEGPAGAAGELTDEQLHQAYEYFEERWRGRLWVERDLMGHRVDLS